MFPLGPKYRAFLRHRARAEFLEGTTAAGKTTVGAVKFVLRVCESPQPQHVLAGLDLGTVEKNVISKANGILDVFGDAVEYRGGGTTRDRMAHLVVHAPDGVDRLVYVLGYDDRTRWRKVLGGQYGCLMVDELNVADIDFVREASMRCDYMLATLNPDDPALPVYREFVDRSRELPEWSGDTPPEILAALDRPPEAGWTHWFFCFSDNASLTPEKVERITSTVPQGTKLWKNKVLGLRGRSTGLVFPTYDPARHDVTPELARAWADAPARVPRGQERPERFVTYTAGLDTAYSQLSADVTAATFCGITDRGRLVLLDCRTWDNRQTREPLAPTDTVRNLVDFLERNRREWGLARHVFIDSADQATITEARKWRRAHPSCLYDFGPAHKRVPNVDRIAMQLGWMGLRDPAFMILAERCGPYVRELGAYSWDETRDSTPEDANDHCIQSCQYAWLPYRARIGIANGAVEEDDGRA